MLVLSGVCVRPESYLDAINDGGREPLWPCQFTIFSARVFPAYDRRATSNGIKFHRYHEVDVIGEAFAKDCSGDVAFVNALHDDNDRRRLHVVQTIAERFAEPSNSLGSDNFGFAVFYVVGIVNDDAIAALAGTNAPD